MHVLALADGMALGTGRLIHGAEALGKTGVEGRVLLGRLAVRKAARGTGLGAELVRALEQAGRERGGTELELHAQVQAWASTSGSATPPRARSTTTPGFRTGR